MVCQRVANVIGITLILAGGCAVPQGSSETPDDTKAFTSLNSCGEEIVYDFNYENPLGRLTGIKATRSIIETVCGGIHYFNERQGLSCYKQSILRLSQAANLFWE